MAEIEEDISHGEVNAQETKQDPLYPHKNVYCPSCSLPPEFCSYGPNFDKCKPWLKKNYPNLYPDLAQEPDIQETTTQVNSVSITKSDDDDAPPALEPAPSTSGKKGKKKEEPLEILITTAQRAKKKFTTSVTGLGRFGIKLNDASRIFAKKFAAAGSVTPDKDEIVIQGEIAQNLAQFIVKNWSDKITPSVVFIVEEGERRNMED